MDMNSDELKFIANHLTNNLKINTDIDRLHSRLLTEHSKLREKAKVARLFIAVENATLLRFTGKCLHQIAIDGKCVLLCVMFIE